MYYKNLLLGTMYFHNLFHLLFLHFLLYSYCILAYIIDIFKKNDRFLRMFTKCSYSIHIPFTALLYDITVLKNTRLMRGLFWGGEGGMRCALGLCRQPRAVTGKTNAPDLHAVMQVLGEAGSRSRIENVIRSL